MPYPFTSTDEVVGFIVIVVALYFIALYVIDFFTHN